MVHRYWVWTGDLSYRALTLKCFLTMKTSPMNTASNRLNFNPKSCKIIILCSIISFFFFFYRGCYVKCYIDHYTSITSDYGGN